MAKKKRAKRSKLGASRRYRDPSGIARQSLISSLFAYDYYRKKRHYRKVREQDRADRRRWKPEILGTAMYMDGTPAEYELRGRTKKGRGRLQTKARIGFVDAYRQYVCIRRAQRRMVMFATGKAGKGRVVKQFRKWVADSNVRC